MAKLILDFAQAILAVAAFAYVAFITKNQSIEILAQVLQWIAIIYNAGIFAVRTGTIVGTLMRGMTDSWPTRIITEATVMTSMIVWFKATQVVPVIVNAVFVTTH